MIRTKQLLRKCVQGLTTSAFALGGATLLTSVFNHELDWLGLEATLRVGVPSFFIGALFFPVDARTLASRAAFAIRAAFAATVAASAHRALLFLARADGPDPLAPLALDHTLVLALISIAAASLTAWLAQPLLLPIARGRVLLSPATRLQPVPVRNPTLPRQRVR